MRRRWTHSQKTSAMNSWFRAFLVFFQAFHTCLRASLGRHTRLDVVQWGDAVESEVMGEATSVLEEEYPDALYDERWCAHRAVADIHWSSFDTRSCSWPPWHPWSQFTPRRQPMVLRTTPTGWCCSGRCTDRPPQSSCSHAEYRHVRHVSDPFRPT